MDKTRKLRRYSKKDYSQLVDFPVEIVGRDGIVRRYTFEASVRLYQRRIASASNRYEDGDVVDAEVLHCRRRIEQLRFSYFQRYGWSSLHKDNSLAALAGEYAGELAAFLRRFYGSHGEPERLEVQWVEDGTHEVIFYVGGDGVSYLLYLFRFSTHDDCEARDRFFELLQLVRSARGEGVERLAAFHHSADCGLVLTGTGVVTPADLGEDGHDGAELDQFFVGRQRPDAYSQALALLSDGDAEAALARFELAATANPFLRPAYVGMAVVADALGQVEAAEMACQMGLHYFPDDAALLYHFGLARFRQGETNEARAHLNKALDQDAKSFPAHFLLGVIDLAEGSYLAARDRLVAARAHARPEDEEAVAATAQLVLRLRLRRALLLSSLVMGVGGAACMALGLAAGPWLLVVALLGAVFGTLGFRISLARSLARPGAPSVRLAPPEAPGRPGRGRDAKLV